MNNNDIIVLMTRSRLQPNDEEYNNCIEYLRNLIESKQYDQFDYILLTLSDLHHKLHADYLMMMMDIAKIVGTELFNNYVIFRKTGEIEIERRTGISDVLTTMGF